MLTTQAAATSTVVLAGLGGALAYAVRIVEPAHGALPVGAATLCVHLAGVASLFFRKWMGIREVPALYNQPGYLLIPGALEQLRICELARLEMRIGQMAALNTERALWLNLERVWA